jgi:hypothetical protein
MLSLAGAWPVFMSMPVLTPTTGKGVAVMAWADCAPAHQKFAATQIAVPHHMALVSDGVVGLVRQELGWRKRSGGQQIHCRVRLWEGYG